MTLLPITLKQSKWLKRQLEKQLKRQGTPNPEWDQPGGLYDLVAKVFTWIVIL